MCVPKTNFHKRKIASTTDMCWRRLVTGQADFLDKPDLSGDQYFHRLFLFQ